MYTYFKRFYLFIFRERGREGEREGEKHQCVVASWAPPTGALACNPGMCPDWESNWRPLGSQASAQTTEPHQSGLYTYILDNIYTFTHIHIKHKFFFTAPRWQGYNMTPQGRPIYYSKTVFKGLSFSLVQVLLFSPWDYFLHLFLGTYKLLVYHWFTS